MQRGLIRLPGRTVQRVQRANALIPVKITASRVALTLQRRCQSQSSTVTHQQYVPPPLELAGRKGKKASKSARTTQEEFTRIGLNDNVSKQLVETYSFIEKPTLAQSALVPAILSPIDVILRAQTGTGKSFGLLLALLSKPRVVFRVKDDEAGTIRGKLDPLSTGRTQKKIQSGIASIIVVPSNELAAQYLRWAQTLFPKAVLASLDPVVQCLVRGRLEGEEALSPQQEIQRLKDTPPHILVTTPGRLADILSTHAGPALLGVTTLRTLVLDEADAILQLPGRFPSHKQRWNHEIHRAPGLEVLNYFMQHRATFSGGEKHMSAGLENRPGKVKDERRPPEQIRRNAYQSAEKRSSENTHLVAPLPRKPGLQPLQLVCTSATANTVLRHFLAARTGWLRPGAKDGGNDQLARWIDLTGLSGPSMVRQGMQGLFGENASRQSDQLIEQSLGTSGQSMPASIEHTCLVIEESPLSPQLARAPMRNFYSSLARLYPSRDENASSTSQASDTPRWEDMVHVVKPEKELAEHELDQSLLESLAFSFASEGVQRGFALIPARWSLLKTRASLEALGLTVRAGLDSSLQVESAADEPVLYLLQTTSARGLDIPSLSHVFLVGIHAVIDAVQYVHSAGRVSRIGSHADQRRAAGKVVALIRGIPHNNPLPPSHSASKKRIVSASEVKMANLYKRLRITPRKLNLQLLEVATPNSAGASLSEYEDAGISEHKHVLDDESSPQPETVADDIGREAATEEAVMDVDSAVIGNSDAAPTSPAVTAENDQEDARQAELEDGGREAATEEVVLETQPSTPTDTNTRE